LIHCYYSVYTLARQGAGEGDRVSVSMDGDNVVVSASSKHKKRVSSFSGQKKEVSTSR
jgi:hypothetical protein